MPVSPLHLRGSNLFSGFTDTGVAIISQIAKLRDIPQGLSIFLEESPGESLFIVHDGIVEILSGPAEKQKVLCEVDKGQHFGELSLLRIGRRQASARAKTACRLVEIKRNDFNELMKTKPQACLKLMLAVFTSLEKRFQAVAPTLRELV